MAVQTAIKTVHGRGVADFSRAFNSPGKGNSIASWGAALDGFEMTFEPPLTGGHNLNALNAVILGTRFVPPHDLSVIAQCGMWDQSPHITLAKMSILGILSSSGETSPNQLYLYNDGPLDNGTVSHNFPAAPAWATAALSGLQMWFEGNAQPLQSVTADVQNPTLTGSQIDCTLNSNFYGSGKAQGNSGVLYVAGTANTPIPAVSAVASWSPGDEPVTATFTGLSFNSATAVLLLSGLNISFGSGVQHQVQKIAFSVGNASTVIDWTSANGSWTANVSFLPSMTLQDSAGHDVDASSYVQAQVLLIPTEEATS